LADEPGAYAPDRFKIQVALAAAGGNVTEAARRLRLKNRFVLYRLLPKNGIAASAPSSAA